jgi:hypothetical protein
MRGRRSILLGLVTIAALASAIGSASRVEAAVYWGGGGGVDAANLDGSVPILGYPYSVANAFEIRDVCGVAVDAGHVYWADGQQGTIGRIAQPSGTVIDRVDISKDLLPADEAMVAGLSHPCGVAVNGTHVYWADRSGMAIGMANLDGSAPVPSLVAGLSGPCGVALDGTYFYWANQYGNSIGRARLDGSEADREFISGADRPCGVAVDGAHIYWANQFGGSIGRADLDGGNPDEGFVAGLDSPCGVAADASGVYWANWQGRNMVGHASLDGSGVNRSLVSTEFYLGSCGVALDSRVFKPAPPPPSYPFFLGKVRHGPGTGVAYVTAKAPDTGGVLTVKTAGLDWKVLDSPARYGGYLLWQIRIRPGKTGGAARRIRTQLGRTGRAGLQLEVTYQEAGKTPYLDVIALNLIRQAKHGHPRHRPDPATSESK